MRKAILALAFAALAGCDNEPRERTFFLPQVLQDIIPLMDVRLDTDNPEPGDSRNLRICRQGDDIYAVWDDTRNTDPDIYFARSVDGGVNWEPDKRLDLAPVGVNSSNPRIACSGDSVYVVWVDRRNEYEGDLYFRRSTDRGATWEAEQRIDAAPAGSIIENPEIACDESNVYVIWVDGRGMWTREVYFTSSTDSGQTWPSADIRVDDNPLSSWCFTPKICCDGSAVYAVWQDTRNGSDDIYFSRSLDAGTTWLLSNARIDTDAPGASGSYEPAMCNSGSHVYVVWSDTRNGTGDIYFNRSLDGGENWLPSDVRLDTDIPVAGNSDQPSIACDGDRVYAAWRDERYGLFLHDIFFNSSRDTGETWLPADLQLDTDGPGASGASRPAVCCAGDNVNVVWEDRRSNGLTRDIRLNRSGDAGLTFYSEDQAVSADELGASRERPRMCTDSVNSLFVAWEDWRNGKVDLYGRAVGP